MDRSILYRALHDASGKFLGLIWERLKRALATPLLIYTNFDKPHNQPFTNICTVPKFAVGAPAAPLGAAGWHRLEQRCRGLDLRQCMSAAERRYTNPADLLPNEPTSTTPHQR